MNSKNFRFLFAGFLVVLLTLGFAVVSLAAVCPTQSTGSPGLYGAYQDFGKNSKLSLLDQIKTAEVPWNKQDVNGNYAVDSQPEQQLVKGVESSLWSLDEQQMLGLINKERASAGKAELKMNPDLVKVARLKAQDMVNNKYFGHHSPNYGSPFDMLKSFGVSYRYAGENLAMAPTVTTAHKALMNSPGHRANILNDNYDQVGIGMVMSGSSKYFVQIFTGGQGSSGSNSVNYPTPSTIASDASTMMRLINQERVRLGQPELVRDNLLTEVANLKAKDFVLNNYYSHTSPQYGSVQNMLKMFDVKYNSYAESLALSTNADRAYNALMKSQANKTNMLSSKLGKVGIGVVQSGNNRYYVLLFTDNGADSQPIPPGQNNPPVTPPVNPDPPQPPVGGEDTEQSDVSGLTSDEQRMLDLINTERAKKGLSPLKANLQLTQVARTKANDMIVKKYFSHNSPTYGSPFDMMKKFGVSYRTAGENLAGASNVDTAHTNLMNSPGHRANILNPNFKEIGIGVLSGSQYGKIFVQMFIG